MLVPVLIVVLMVKLASSTGNLDALLGDKDGLFEGGPGDKGGVPPEAFSGLSPAAARGMPDPQFNENAVVM